MNKLLISLLVALSFSAVAKDVAYVPNRGGGRIVFTDDVCVMSSGKELRSLRQAYNYGNGGSRQSGCFYLDPYSGMLKVLWDDNTEYVYPILELQFFK